MIKSPDKNYHRTSSDHSSSSSSYGSGYDSDSAELGRYFADDDKDVDESHAGRSARPIFPSAAVATPDDRTQDDPVEALPQHPFSLHHEDSSFAVDDLLDDQGERRHIAGVASQPDFRSSSHQTVDFGGNERNNSSERAAGSNPNQEYYDVLEMAKTRLKADVPSDSVPTDEDARLSDDDDDDDGDELPYHHYDRKKRKKSKKHKKEKKSKKEKKRRSGQSRGSHGIQQPRPEERRRSAVFQTLFRETFLARGERTKMGDYFTTEEKNDIEMTPHESDFSIDGENDDDSPNKGASPPRSWNPAALVTMSKSNMEGGKTDEYGYYKTNTNGSRATMRKTTLGKLRDLLGTRGVESHPYEEVENLAPKGIKNLRNDSVVWADDSITEREIDGLPQETIDDCNYDDFNQVNQNYRATASIVQDMLERKKRRRNIIVLCVIVAIITISIIIFATRDSKKLNERDQSIKESTSFPVLGWRKEPPPRPNPPTPSSIDVTESSTFHEITETDLYFIALKITGDKALLENPDSPQKKAMDWCKTDMVNYNVEVAARVAQRYVLATLYYSTKGDSWSNSTGWLSGHECFWSGIACETKTDGFPSITYLDLSSNGLDGKLISELGYLTSLTQLHLWGNKGLHGTIPETFGRLVNLHTLYLDKNSLEGGIGFIVSLKNLKHLDLSENKLRGQLPHSLGGISTLYDLRLSQNHFSGALPFSMIQLTNLQTLLLDNNAFGGSLPSVVGSLKNIVSLRLHENDFIGTLPSFADAQFLMEAHLDENDFSGGIPQFGSKSLRDLFLGKNSLTGTIPDIFGEKRELEVLSLRANRLFGSIPKSLAKATALKKLDLSYNKLSGEIFQDLSNLIQLREFRLNDNHFDGSFPNFLGSFQQLEVVHVNNNLLSGDLALPLNVGDLEYLKEFEFQNNELKGVVPEFICDLLLDVLSSDCWGSSSPIDCPCCTQCY